MNATDEASAAQVFVGLERAHKKAHKLAMTEAVKATGAAIKSSSAMPILAGNLRDSVGHKGPIAAAPGNRSLGLGEPDFKKLVRVSKLNMTAKLPVGMEYASQKNRETKYFDFGVDAAEATFLESIGAADEKIARSAK